MLSRPVHTLAYTLWMAGLVALAVGTPFSSAFGQEADLIRLRPDMNKLPLNARVRYLEDATSQLTVSDVASPTYRSRFFSASENSFGYTDSTYWVRLNVMNPGDASLSWILELDYSVFDQVELFGPEGELIGKGGDLFEFDERDIYHRNVAFRLTLPGKSTETFYLRLRSESSMTIPLYAYSHEAFFERVTHEQVLFGLYYGAMLVMLVYNLFLYFSTRASSYLYYVAYLGTYVLFQGTINGLTFQYLWPEHVQWANFCLPPFIILATAAGGFFGRSFLYSGERPRLWEYLRPWRIIRIASGLENWLYLAYLPLLIYSVVSLALVPFVPYSLSIQLSVIGTIPYVSLILVNSLVALLNGQRSARYFFIAWITLLIGVIIYSSKSFGWLPTNFFTIWAIQIGSLIEVVLLSLALADRINEMSRKLEDQVVELNQAQVKIKKNEKRFRNLFDGADEFIFTLDANHNFDNLNKSVRRLLGFTPTDLRGTNFFSLFFREKTESLSEYLAREKLAELTETGHSVLFKAVFQQKHMREPRELLVRLQYLEGDDRQEILGRASLLEADVIFQDLRSERMAFTTGNLIGNVDTICDRLTIHLRGFVDEQTFAGIRISVREVLINAIEHGNLHITFDEKSDAIDNERYFEFLQERQSDPRYRDKKVLIDYSLNPRYFGLRVTDEGEGFDHRKMMSNSLARLNKEAVGHGRGIFLMLDTFDVVRYNDKGNQVVLVKYFNEEDRNSDTPEEVAVEEGPSASV